MKGAAALLLLSLCACGSLPKVFRAGDPLSADEHARLGAAYESQGDKAEAEKQYRRSLVLDRRRPEAWLALGNLAYGRGDLKLAERCYRKALKLAPEHAGAENNLAMVALSRGRLKEARALAEGALPRAGELRPHVLDTLERVAAAERLHN